MTQKEINDSLRAQYTKDLIDFLSTKYDTDVCQIAAGAVMIPVLDANQNESWIKFTIVIPKNPDEAEGTDGYSLAREYALKVEEKNRKRENLKNKKNKT